MTELSPAAQAVSYAYDNAPERETGNHRYHWLAAALRAAADQFFYDWNGMCCEEHLKSIADELEAL